MNTYESQERNNYIEFLSKEDRCDEDEIKEFYQGVECEDTLVKNVEVIE